MNSSRRKFQEVDPGEESSRLTVVRLTSVIPLILYQWHPGGPVLKTVRVVRRTVGVGQRTLQRRLLED